MSADKDASAPMERRQNQRIWTSAASDSGFFCVINGQRWPLLDLSLTGFALPAAAQADEAVFSVMLECTGKPDAIQAQARVVNRVAAPGSAQTGCLFEPLTESQNATLRAWLVDHVLRNASVPINEDDALRIVTGPSLV